MKTVRQMLQIKGYDVWSIGPNETVYDALRLMARQGVGALLVMEGDDLIGILSERDYARKIILHGKNSKETPVSEIMTDQVYTVHPEQTVEECMELMTEKRIRHLPVVENERVIGVISVGDVIYNLIHKQRETIRSLEGRAYGS